MNDPSAQIFAIALAATWCGFGLYGVLRKIERSPQARELLERFRRARLSTKAAFVAGLIAVVAVGGTKPGDGNGGGLRGGPSAPEGPPPDPAFGIVEVRTNNVALRAESASSVEVTDWRRHGSATGGVWLDFDEPFFRIGTNPVSRAYVAAGGSISFDTTRRPPVGAPLPDGTGLPSIAPLLAPLGMVPEANWGGASRPGEPLRSRFWHDEAPGRGRVFTWENALLDRLPGRRVSVQAELLPSGDFTYRYDFADALDPPATNLVLGAQVGTNGVNALYFGPLPEGAPGEAGWGSLSAPVWRVDGVASPPGEPQSIADILCTNGVLRAPARFAIEWKNTSDLDSNADSDGDGLSDWDEIFRLGTDPNQADTDGDGLSDGPETLAGANPLDADENGDGIPDGVSAEAWTSDPIWAENSGKTNLVVTLGTAIPDGAAASLVLGSVTIPLRSPRHYVFGIPSGVEVPFRLFSRGIAAVDLSMSNALPGQPPRLLRSSPNRPQKEFNGPCLRLHDLLGVFDGKQTKGEGFVAEPRIYLRCESGDDDMLGSCIHGEGFCVYSIVTEPASCAFELHEADEIDGFQIQQGKYVSLYVTDAPGDSDYGYIRFGPKYHCWGDADIYHGIHRCEGGHHVWCHVCGTYHDDWNACSHEPDCAAVLDASADCTCGGLYVHVAWRDEDGNGTPDLADDHLVGGGGAATFTALGGFIDDCCCRWAYEPDDAEVRILSVSSNLRLWADATNQLHAGDTGTVFTIQATAPSSSVGGSHVAYEIVGPSNNVLRTLHVPVTAWDIWDTGLAFNWATNVHSADAINLRRDFATPIDYAHGEWEKPRDHAAAPTRDEPACWIAGTRPMVMARFEVRPADIRSAALSAFGFSPIFSWIGETTVSFSNGVTKAAGPSPHPDYAAFAFALDVPSVVSRSTNELWHWSATSIDGHALPSPVSVATNGPSVAYSILGNPVAPWTDANLSNTNVWASALEFVTKTNLCLGATTQTGVISNLTQSLFQNCHFTYDTTSGAPHFFDSRNRAFRMSDYVFATKTTADKMVNCFDQAHGLSYLSALCGTPAEIVRMEPFGYLNPGHLVGVSGLCNNPFYSSPWVTATSPSCGTNDTSRSKFSCHFFVRHNSSIFDSCAGPALGTETLSEYVSRMVDTSTSGERFYKVHYRDRYGFVHEKTVEGGVATNAVPYTDIKTIE